MKDSNEYIKAVECLKATDYAEALNWINKAIQKEEQRPDYYSERGVIYFHLEKLDLAIQDMDKAVSLQPDYSYRYSSRAFIRSVMKNVDGAIADYEKAIELDPEDSVAHNNLGLLLEKKGYEAKSKANFARADELAGVSPERAIHAPEPTDGIEVKPKKIKIDAVDSVEESKGQIAKKVLTDKSTFKEFIQFIKNGFKIKEEE